MAFSKAGHYTDPLIDALGKPQKNITVTVYARGTTNLATLWTSRLKETQADNPTSSDANGNLSFYADPGEYDLKISTHPVIPITVPLDPLEVDSETASPGGDFITANNIWEGHQYFKSGRPWADLRAHGATGSGVDDDTAAFEAAKAALGATGGIIYGPPGTYKTSSTIIIDNPNISFIGAGSQATVLAPTNNGDCIRVQMNPWTVAQAGRIAGLKITGNTGASASGIHLGDTIGFELDDLVITGFTNGSGLWLENATNWTERLLTSRVHLDNNKKGLRLSVSGTGTNSFGFSKFSDLRLNVNDGQVGISAENNALIYNSEISLMANVADAGVVIDVTGTAQFAGNDLYLAGEQTSGTGGIGIRVASGAAFWGYGTNRLQMANSNANAAAQTAKLRIIAGTAKDNGGSSVDDAGSIANFRGTGNAAKVIPLLTSDPNTPLSSFGMLDGTNITCPYVCMFDQAGSNSFIVYKLGAGAAPNTMVEVFRVDANGQVNVTTAGDVSSVKATAGRANYEMWRDTTPSSAVSAGMATPGGSISDDYKIALYNTTNGWVERMRVSNTQPGDGETALLVSRNVGGTISIQRVSMGATDSGGAGFKLLRVPN